jgi:putative membrane protein
MMDRYWDHGWGGMGFGGSLMLLFWILLIVGVVLLVRWLATGDAARRPGPPRNAALDLLKERYARGEIERDEFEQKRRDLET